MIPITTPKAPLKSGKKTVGITLELKYYYSRRAGINAWIYECFDGYFPNESIEYIYYDQLGSYYSDQPNDDSLWTNERLLRKWNKSDRTAQTVQIFMF
jgi:proline iminopeptidase